MARAATATTIVFFVGGGAFNPISINKGLADSFTLAGCTFTEIAALRKIAEGVRGEALLLR